MLEQVIFYLSWILIAVGVFLVITGAVGVLKFPDFFSRLHPAGIIDSCATMCIIGGLILQHGFTLFTLKLVILALFILITGPTATHVLAKAAMLQGIALPNKKVGASAKQPSNDGGKA